MSGGHYDYVSSRIRELSEEISQGTKERKAEMSKETLRLRMAFARHLKKVSEACHDIEWVDSGDSGTGDENKAIKKCLR